RTLSVTAAGGFSLVDNTTRRLTYNQAPGIETFINDLALQPLLLENYSDTGELILTQTLISGGTEDNITPYISGGKLAAMQHLRDIDILNSIKQLDNLSARIRDEVNAIHSSGSGLPMPGKLEGTKEFNLLDRRQFSGEVLIAVQNDTGGPLVQADGTQLKPLVLNFDLLNEGSAVNNGLVSMQTIIDEINQYYFVEPVHHKTSLGEIYDLQMVSKSNAIVPDGQFTFVFQLNSNAKQDIDFRVDGITMYDSAGTIVTPLTPTVLPTTDFRVEGGKRIMTDFEITVDFDQGSIANGGAGGPYTIRADVATIAANGEIHETEIDFVIDDTPVNPDLMNRRYTVEQVFSGDAEITQSGTTQRFMEAKFVDDNGDLQQSTLNGFLTLETSSENYG
ncbi:MAG: hypothetical protein AAF153_03260, partial [Pseudomonadota bacterium]